MMDRKQTIHCTHKEPNLGALSPYSVANFWDFLPGKKSCDSTLRGLLFGFVFLLRFVASFIHQFLHPFCLLSPPSARVQTLSSPLPPLLMRSPLIPSILPSLGENLSIFNPAASSSASCHTGPTAISKANTVVSHRGLVDLPFHSSCALLSPITIIFQV